MIRMALAAVCALLFSITTMTPFVQASEITISGSTSVARIMDVLAEKYNQQHPETYVAVQGVGSTAGISLLKKGVADIAMTSRYLTESESQNTLHTFTLAFDGLAIVVNQANPVTNLTREQLYGIYKGQITNWKQVGGNDQKIAVVTREASSGTRYSFESLMGLTKTVKDREVSDVAPTALVVNSNSMMKTLVNHNTQAVGFISIGSVDKSVKAIQFEKTDPTSDNIAKHTYQLSRPFLILHYSDKADEQTKEFIAFLKSESAKKLIVEYGYIMPSDAE
ncbi:phosphate ABC transporter substrate-binding protein PstS family protein [Vibrio cholerae]|uniref:phosphate ABC transporter substrate-binding protein PstS family protein n=1 Tax=Vibrio cholerae TaxID=666 RepID=UPI00115B71F6|nr:phosphate ABC transporter substrate-binding protein PstS family protein [Vibrio cholerae]EGR2427057.1 phosphate ABC transporter substrate-binding protein PstS family protein [Vibrio cholerae]EJL6355841.1 phosphate ABC transporter substrate-binding protein PstS family protein [Vibrio cholerae]EJY0881666.1 phosphate ABC transporter substrate-binding protein PstS family protein [Vibrio cholerae]NOE65240.1 phosphate ABC transporter substrate-binding protein PstS family protein [Vibrio cholerae]